MRKRPYPSPGKRTGARGLANALLAAFLLLAGCTPLFSQRALQEVDRGISFPTLLTSPEAFKGRVVMVGGAVIETRNLADLTVLVVLEQALDFRDKPSGEDRTSGRFIVRVRGFLDPAIYRPGRLITVIGAVAGQETHPLGERDYPYPVLESRELYLWPAEEPYGSDSGMHLGLGVGIGL